MVKYDLFIGRPPRLDSSFETPQKLREYVLTKWPDLVWYGDTSENAADYFKLHGEVCVPLGRDKEGVLIYVFIY
jgi:hypothetical protein